MPRNLTGGMSGKGAEPTMNDKLFESLNEYNRILLGQVAGANSRQAKDFVRLHQDDADFLELAEEARILDGIRRRRLTWKWGLIVLGAVLLTGATMTFLKMREEGVQAQSFRDETTKSVRDLAKVSRLLYDRNDALASLMLLRPAESFALIYPPNSPRWSGIWNQEIAFAWARYAFLDWQIHAFEDGPRREELERRIRWFRERYPEAGDIEVLEGRKFLALPGGPNYRLAHEAFTKAILKRTTDPAAWANRGWCRRHLPGIDEQGVYEEILADFREALRRTLERRKGDPHDVSFATPLTNYRSTIAMVLATAAKRGQDQRSEALGPAGPRCLRPGDGRALGGGPRSTAPDSHRRVPLLGCHQRARPMEAHPRRSEQAGVGILGAESARGACCRGGPPTRAAALERS